MRPLVGITTYAEQARWGVWDLPAALIPLAYVRAVERAGGRPLLVPPSDDAIDETLDALEALLLTGGPDLDPALYGAVPHPETLGVRPERDRAEIALLRAAVERDMPVLAVCRGSQVLNVALGGDLVQHVPEVVGHDGHKRIPGAFAEHDVELRGDSRLGQLLGRRVVVKSHHHQGYGRLGAGLRGAAWADDGTVEAIEDPDRRFTVGVLWHPEEDVPMGSNSPGEGRPSPGGLLFRALVEEARAYRQARR